jgi:hypothetical protein
MNTCREKHGIYECNLLEGHNGDHIVYGPAGTTKYVWENLQDRPETPIPFPQDEPLSEAQKQQIINVLEQTPMNGENGLRQLARKAVMQGKIANKNSREVTSMSKKDLVQALAQIEIDNPQGIPIQDNHDNKNDNDKPDMRNDDRYEDEQHVEDNQMNEQQEPNNNDPLEKIIAERIDRYIKGKGINEDQISKLIQKALTQNDIIKPTIVESPNGARKNVGLTHYKFTQLLDLVRNGHHIWLTGPSGSGKTYLCEQVASAMDLEFESISVGMQTSKSDLFGYMDAHGNYIPTSFYRAFFNGSLFCLDEVDNGNPNVLAMINAATSNNVCGFPNGMVKKHEDFRIITCANTYGLGSDAVYVGRNQIDGATRNRFAFVELPYDTKLEKRLTGNPVWHDIIMQVRQSVDSLREKVIVSPRASIRGASVLQLGYTVEETLDMLVFQGINNEIKKRILNNSGLTSDQLKTKMVKGNI